MAIWLGAGLLFLMLAAVLAVPLLLLAGMMVLALRLVLLPFKVVGWGLKAGAGLVGLILRLGFSLVGLVVIVLLCVGLLPLTPILLLGVGLYLILRRHRETVRSAG